jgi:hypothetical protein
MIKHETKFCPRCNNPFECKVGSVSLCQCSTITLNEQERNFISNSFEDCLCAACMQAMKEEHHKYLFQEQLKKISKLF